MDLPRIDASIAALQRDVSTLDGVLFQAQQEKSKQRSGGVSRRHFTINKSRPVVEYLSGMPDPSNGERSLRHSQFLCYYFNKAFAFVYSK